MTDFWITLLKSIAAYSPLMLLLWLNSRANLKRRERSSQFPLPLFALLYSVVMMFLADALGKKLTALLLGIPTFLEKLPLLSALAPAAERMLDAIRIELLLFYALNAALLVLHILLKSLCLPLLRKLCDSMGEFADEVRGTCYEQDPVSGLWVLRRNCAQGRTFLKTMYLAAICISFTVGRVAVKLYFDHRLSTLFYPVFGVIVLGELYFFVNGLSRQELEEDVEGEGERPQRFCNYAPLRAALRRLFPDKLAAENTVMGASVLEKQERGTGLGERIRSDDPVADAYYAYMYKQQRAGLRLDPGYLASGLNLTRGRNVLFNDPFYYDLIPYAFYAMNRSLLQHRKVLVVLGRHGVEEDVALWLERGLRTVTNVPQMWSIGVLNDREQEVQVGIVTRSGVHELELHTQNEAFFREVGMVVLIEPSRLLTTAQIGLNSIVRRCRREGVTYCSTDRNCDGLVDALSHLLMADITEVSATNRHEGTCSYMCWETDGDNLQHRLLPDISRYLGMGTELSFAALKNQVEKAVWHGGEAFPVRDMHWIARQYYYELLRYANLPPTQEELDRRFAVSYNTWNEPVQENRYFVVEDENCNMFEIKREFATRATGQSFINIISPQYLLHDYMAENEGLFNADPKAIPAIVADYAATRRNVALRLLLRMSSGDITKRELADELQLIGVGGTDPVAQLWELLCGLGSSEESDTGEQLLVISRGAGRYVFRREETVGTLRKYSPDTGEIDDFVRIMDSVFRELLLHDLQNARYVSEEEDGGQKYLGSELIGHTFQRYLPGQFFTFEGKYYEMLRMTPDGRVVLRRAAEHITDRSYYRQLRNYRIRNVEAVDEMGACRSVGGMRISRRIADISVETPGYWQLRGYQDFAGGKRVELNGVPVRDYSRKQILCVAFRTEDGAPLDDRRCQTLALLLNEVFRTVFSSGSDYIVALTPGSFDHPMTYSLLEGEGFDPEPGCIYFVEDSQIDLGLLIAVERNLQRLFEIVCDYLDWHFEAVEKSEAAERAAAAQPTEAAAEAAEEPEEKVPEQTQEKAPRKGFFARLMAWLHKLFGKKAGDESGEPDAVDAQEPEHIAEEAEDEAAADPAVEAEIDADSPGEEPAAETVESEAEQPEGELIRCSISGDGEADAEEEDSFEFEKPETERVAESAPTIPTRKPYHQRCYLYYGETAVPEQLDPAGTLAFLRENGFGGRALEQARHGREVAAQIAEDYRPGRPGVHYCDFCGAELIGTEYDVLKDGRESCTACSNSAIRTEEEFRELYRELTRNMEVFYGAHIHVPVKVRMVNARRLHKSQGKVFVPTSKADARIVGLAIQDKNGFSILVENGAPRLSTMMAMVHEMTHIWQYTHWDRAAIRRKYGAQELEVYEGMAKWSEIQYAYLIGELGVAKREEITTSLRQDEYGRGFLRYAKEYPISERTQLEGATPFDNIENPL